MRTQSRASTDTDADDATVIQLSRHEPEQFTELFRRHAPHIQRYVTRRLGTALSHGQGADDIVAETFLLAFRQRDKYDGSRADARPWLYGIATNLIGRHRRSEIRQYRALARTGADPVMESFTDRVDDQVSASSASRAVAAALAGLSADLRDTLLLAAWTDLSYEQIAAALRVPAGTVRSRLSRARTKLRKTLGDADPSALSEETSNE